MKKFTHILVDGQNALFRAAYSYSDLSVVRGDGDLVFTGAIFGFLQIVLSLYRKHAAEGCELIICWDAGYDHRVALYPEYKANRRQPKDPQKTEDPQLATISDQGKMLREILEALGWRQARARGFEADDVMATLARQNDKPSNRVAIYTGDKDLHQCVSDHVVVLSGNAGKEMEWGPAEVSDLWKLPASRVAEAKALAGDGGDNIPGCPGCGMGWAQKILNEDTLESALEKARKGVALTGIFEGKPWTARSMTTKFREHEELIRISYELSKVIFDAPIKFNDGNPDEERVKELLFEYRFHSLLKEGNFNKLISMRPGVKEAPSSSPDIFELLGL